MVSMASEGPVSLTSSTSEPLRAADGTPLKKRLNQALFRSRLRAFMLVLPLLIFILISFVFPIGQLLFQGAYNDTFSSNMPRTAAFLQTWDAEELPGEDAFEALVLDLADARKAKSIGRVASRVNRELSGTRSLFTSSARRAGRLEAPYKEALIDTKKAWGELETWHAMKIVSNSLTANFYLNSLDMRVDAKGSVVAQDEDRQIHIKLFMRTLWISGLVTFFCFLLGFPVAYMLATLPLRYSNLLMILVLLPFWTSLLVRTSAWIALLQGQGVLNDLVVLVGITDDDARFSMIYNQFGTIVAMTHILLPFMILPLYSVMKTIPPSYMRAARSLGANQFLAYRRVYFPQTLPGIAAGSLLVFILAIGYYITPALVGGQDGQLISNIIAFHMQKSLNWSLAAALGGILLVGVLVLYWLYNKLIGVDNLKLG